MGRLRLAGVCVVVLAVAGLDARAQTTPPQGTLQAPKPGSHPAAPAAPPKAAPITPVQRVAPVAESSALGHSAPGKPPPVVPPAKNGHAQKPPPAKHSVVTKPVAAAAAVGATAVVLSKPADAPVATTPPPPEKPPVDPNKGSVTGQPIPRWAALRSDEVNLRKGPGQRYPIEWVYRRRDLPVQIEREFEVWRLVADQDGVKGWVHSATLTGRRGFVVKGGDATLRARARDDADPVAILKPGVVGHINSCAATAEWCDVGAGSYHGWIKRSAMWGISAGEAVGS